MKKSVYTLFVLLLCGVQSLLAADAGYIKYQLKTQGDFPTTNSAFRGVFYADKANTYKSGVNCKDDTTQQRWTMKKNDCYIKVESTVPFAEGDTISIVATPKSTSSTDNGVTIRLTNETNADTVAVLSTDRTYNRQTLKHIILSNSKLIGEKCFYVSLTDKTSSSKKLHWYESITVTSPFPQDSTVKISENMEYATYSNPTYSVDFTDSGAKAYIIKKGDDDNSITFSEVTRVPANTGVLLMGTKGGTVTIKATNEEEDDVTDNLLVADDGTKTASTGAYLLSYKDSKAAFYKSNTGRSLTAGKAHLEFPSGTNTASLAFYLDMLQPTGISGVQADSDAEATDDADGVIYNLSGQKVDGSYKGIVIKNGKKYLQK